MSDSYKMLVEEYFNNLKYNCSYISLKGQIQYAEQEYYQNNKDYINKCYKALDEAARQYAEHINESQTFIAPEDEI